MSDAFTRRYEMSSPVVSGAEGVAEPQCFRAGARSALILFALSVF
jgi:hypothetical protein